MNSLAGHNYFHRNLKPTIESAIERSIRHPVSDYMLRAYENFVHEYHLLERLSLIDKCSHRYRQSYCNLISENIHIYLDSFNTSGLYLVVYHLKYMDNTSARDPIV